MNKKHISKKFLTDTYKRFWYPTRPFFTLGLGFCLIGLGVGNILPMAWALWLAAVFAFDDLPLTPMSSFVTAMNNLIHGRKKLKSTIMLIAMSFAILVGSCWGLFIMSQHPSFVLLVSHFILATGCSPLLIFIGAILGAMGAQITNKISHFHGVGLGIFLMSLMPFSVPLILDFVFINVAIFAFITGLVTKQLMRAYYKIEYGHSNADGYSFNRTKQEQLIFIENQAQKFDVTANQFNQLIHFCHQKIQETKQQASFWEEWTGSRQNTTNSYKDIYHGLMNPKANKKDVEWIKQLLLASQHGVLKRMAFDESKNKRNEVVMKNQFFCKDEFTMRLFFHQAQIYPGLHDEYVTPFLNY